MPKTFNTTELAPLLDRMDIGDIAERELLTDDEDRGIASTVPCCGRKIRLSLWVPSEDKRYAICCRCRAGYRVSFREEMTGYDDDPFRTALFTVEMLDIGIALHRG